MPLVSVIIPTKDRPAGLRRALESLAAQTLDDFEAVVVNDAGQDVGELVAEYAPRIAVRLLAHETRAGAAAARNTGLAEARGRFVAYLDDDDAYLPEHLERLTWALEHYGLPVVYSDAQCVRIDPDADDLEILEQSTLLNQDFSPDILLIKNYIPTLCVVHERSLLATCGRFDTSLPILEDWEFWIRLSRRHEFGHLPLVTARYHRHPETAPRTNLTTARRAHFIPGLIRIYLRYKHHSRTKPAVLREQTAYLHHQARKAALIHRMVGDIGTARRLESLMGALAQARTHADFTQALERYLARA